MDTSFFDYTDKINQIKFVLPLVFCGIYMEAILVSTAIVTLAEMGDKSQLATIALAAHYSAPVMVIAGTTLGMLIADVPDVFLGQKLAEKISLRLIHAIAAAIFAVMGLLTLVGIDKLF